MCKFVCDCKIIDSQTNFPSFLLGVFYILFVCDRSGSHVAICTQKICVDRLIISYAGIIIFMYVARPYILFLAIRLR